MKAGVCMYKIAILEDTPEEAEAIRSALTRYASEHKLPFSLRFYPEGGAFLEDGLDFDLVLMDIEMPGLDGMATARKLRERDEDTCLIFVTKLYQYAIEGYSVRAMDFVVKPVTPEKLAPKLERALRQIDRQRSSRIVVQTGESTLWLDAAELLYVEVMNHTLYYHTKSGRFSAYGTIKDCEQKLAPLGFARCSNSFLVNLRHVNAVSGGEVLVGGDRLPIGRTKRREFLQRMAEFAGDIVL